MTHWTHVLKKPVVSERSTLLREQNKYVFEVATPATKGQIREAVEAAFKVQVKKVHTAMVRGRMQRRMTAHPGLSADWKKAIVTLKPGQEIRFAETTG